MHEMKRFKVWLLELRSLRWRDAVLTLHERFREDRLGLVAGSLTFTTIIALVPFLTVALAIFTAFPMFAKFQDVLQKWLLESLVPDAISRQVLGYLSQFAGKASKLGSAGLLILLASALALVFTIDRTLNSIWRVRTKRAFGQRLLVYWASLTLGPLLLGASLTLTSYALSVSHALNTANAGSALSEWLPLLLDFVQFILGAGGMAALFHYVPNTFVRWGHAWIGGLFVATGMELARKALAFYLAKVPTYSIIYGAFATVPILLIWIYMVWVLVLLGAALTAYIPGLIGGTVRRRTGHGWQFSLALEVLQALDGAARGAARGLTMAQLCSTLRADGQRVEPVLEELIAIDWIGQLNESDSESYSAGSRYVLLANPETTRLDALLDRLLLPRNAVSERLWRNGRWAHDRLRDVL